MLSYQHGYHAGGPADVHKHAILAALITVLVQKTRPISYLESHAGRGLYDLAGDQAAKTGEWRAGIGRLDPEPHPYWEAVNAVRRTHGPHAYPGSPALAQALLRPQDRIVLMELHPAEHAALKDALGEQAEIHRRDGYEGLLALCPPQPRRGLVLIDPSYERKEEYSAAAAFTSALHEKWPQAVIAVWYPILPAQGHRTLIGALAKQGLKHEIAFPAHRGREAGMTGSGMLIVNAPYGFDAELAKIDALCAPLR